ncbi:AfsR/SARP family transcriptional regulator [Micromonospora endophytica]|uniref:Uncharacterized protein n=1 Tax=Micromonospora endophytica TaxID=515350 RepID=A0A2W2DK81_9ACTN|nr:AfsR/SARP family transcriptional regulator [Micromonospora endophytica]PZG01220.1 hypothetical protein C1I93_00465 [Micromonospora endophytica]RIW45839.1 hypothetical protein D3H59_14115 [Micromonospora endophytica]BCJ61901.1 hypothetical protein Jiend_53230 [Micromonospora endophytica]
MNVNVLGELRVTENGRPVVPSAAKPRQVLALLTLRGDRVVQAGVLMEELWGSRLPRSASTTLQTYVLNIRNKLAAALPAGSGRSAKDVLVTCYGGYLLKLGDGRFDLREFEAQAAAGDAAYEIGDLPAAATLFRRALGQWQGSALLDVPHGRILQREVISMEHRRMAVLEQWIDVSLRLGRHAALLPELSVLVDEHPLHEGFRAQFMLALYRTGHVRRALQEFQALRLMLVDELGVEPSARLRRLHHAILCGNPIADPEEEFQQLTG